MKSENVHLFKYLLSISKTFQTLFLGWNENSTQWSVPTFCRGVKLTTRTHLVPTSRKVELYLHSPIRLHGVVLNYLSKGTTLPFLPLPKQDESSLRTLLKSPKFLQ
jgi:hypothetical protein